jgi:diadenosine tetraphosphatase ApaH/serine/threonine PP2A family protein phosphatase
LKIAVITDIHGNREALEAVLLHAQGQHVDNWALLGDFVGYGADPGWVVDRIEELQRLGAWVVGGNHDSAVSKASLNTMHADARRVVEWTREQLSPAQTAWLSQLPLTAQHDDVLFVHANAYQPGAWDYIQGRLEAVRSMQATRCRITFCGHMHEPRLFHLATTGKAGDFIPVGGSTIPLLEPRRWLVIPGSCGQSRDGNPAACYATFRTDTAELVFWRVPYDHDTAAAKVLEAGLPAALAERLIHGQ